MDPWTRFDPPCALKSTSWAFFSWASKGSVRSRWSKLAHNDQGSAHVSIDSQLTYRATLSSLPFMVGINQEWQFPMSESAIIGSFR